MFRRNNPTPTPEAPIYLISMASWPNYGDELITRRWLHHLAANKPTTEVWLDVREPGLATSLFAGDHPNLRITNTLFRALHHHLHGDPRTPADLVRDLGSPKYDLGLLDLRRAGSIHLLGGGYINATWADHLHLVNAMRATRDLTGAKLYATGQGLMPFAGETFKDFDHLSVRDTPSAHHTGIELGIDDAYLFPPHATPQHANTPAPTPDTAELYICVQSDALDAGSHEALVELTRQQIQALEIPRERTYYVEAIPGDDRPGYDALRDHVADNGFIPFAHFWRHGFTFAPHQVWLTSRFHHHVMASAHGARGIALNGKKGYYDVKHSSIQALGSNWPIISADAPPTRPYQLQDLPAPADFTPAITAKQAEATLLYPAT